MGKQGNSTSKFEIFKMIISSVRLKQNPRSETKLMMRNIINYIKESCSTQKQEKRKRHDEFQNGTRKKKYIIIIKHT